MCIYPHGSRIFMIARVNSTFLGRRLTTVSLDNIDFQLGYILRASYIVNVHLSTPAHTTYILAYSFAFTHHLCQGFYSSACI